MPEHVESQESPKSVDETVSEVAAEKRIERVAEKEAEKSTKTVQHYDEKHSIFSK
jgi:K+-transporting ATPase c subunit